MDGMDGMDGWMDRKGVGRMEKQMERPAALKLKLKLKHVVSVGLTAELIQPWATHGMNAASASKCVVNARRCGGDGGGGGGGESSDAFCEIGYCKVMVVAHLTGAGKREFPCTCIPKAGPCLNQA